MDMELWPKTSDTVNNVSPPWNNNYESRNPYVDPWEGGGRDSGLSFVLGLGRFFWVSTGDILAYQCLSYS